MPRPIRKAALIKRSRSRRHRHDRPAADPLARVELVGFEDAGWRDAYHKLLTISLPSLLGLVAGSYLAANLLFALAYLDVGGVANARPGSLADMFFFSVQTMATIGYGNMYPVSLPANVLATAEAVYGLLTVAVATGVMFARVSRPTARILFSRAAVITLMDGCPTLMFRVANQRRRNRIIDAQISVTLLRDDVTAEGMQLRRFHDLTLVRSRSPMLALTWTVMHPIQPGSPLYGLDAESFRTLKPDIICSITGLDDVSMQTIHARHTYEAADVKWQARLVNVFLDREDGSRIIDYARFHETEEVSVEGGAPSP